MPLPQANYLKGIVALIASVGFLAAGLIVAWHARHYQLINQPMPNGKGGFMTPGDGYLIAIVFFLFAVAALWMAYKACLPKGRQ